MSLESSAASWTGADLALFSMSVMDCKSDGKNYLIPIDARVGDLALDAVDVGTVRAQMETDKRVNLVFLDACRDNPLARSLARSLHGPRWSGRGWLRSKVPLGL